MTPTGTGEDHAQEPRLESWKAISQFLGRSVTTVQRWEAEEGFPVHRLPHKKRASVYAYPSEIERWMKLREAAGAADPAPVLPSPPPLHRRKPLMWIPVAAALCGAYLIPHLWPRSVRQTPTPTMVPITSYAGIEQHPHFSPDGGQVVFVWERDNREYDLYVKDYPDGRPRQITSTKEREGSPRWSPDGRSIVFARYEAAPTRRIFVLDLEKKTERQVATIEHARRQAIYAEWTPDSSALLISDRASPDLPFRVERMALDATLTRAPLTNPPTHIFGDIYGVMSPDGRSLAFARCVREQGGCDIFVQQLPKGIPRKLTSVSSPVWGLCWLPDSMRLVYSSGRGGRFQLWETGIDGLDSGLKLLGDHVGVVMHPAVRPGRPSAEPEVAFEHLIRHDHIWRLDLKNPEPARRPEQVTRSTWSDHTPVVSPDGTMLAFTSDQSGTSGIWVAPSDGKGIPQLLTRTQRPHRNVWASSWSPDGKSLSVFPMERHSEIRLDDHQITQLSLDAPDGGTGHFRSRDGRSVFFFAPADGKPNLWVQAEGSRTAKRITPDRAAAAAESFDGKTVYYTKHLDYPYGLWSIPLGGGPEKLVVPGVRTSSWSASREGIYFLDFSDGSRNRYLPRDVLFHRFKTGGTQKVAHLESAGAVNLLTGFSVSADGRWIYWSQRDYLNSDISMLTGW